MIISAPKTVKNCLRKPKASIKAGVTWNKKVKPEVTLNTWQLSGLISHWSEKLSKNKTTKQTKMQLAAAVAVLASRLGLASSARKAVHACQCTA